MARTSGFRAAISATKFELLNAVGLCMVFGLMAWLTQATLTPYSMDSSETSAWNPLIWFGISDTLAVLTILSSVLSTITVMLLFESFDMIGWMLAKRDSGVKTIRLLGISSMTGVTGASGLIFSKHTTVVDKILIAAKLLLLAGSWVSGLLLFAKTSITSVNNTISTYNVTAGIGSFRGAFVPEFLQQLQNTNAGYDKTVLPYSIITTASQLTINSRYAVTTKPVGCDSPRDCNSYLFPGALMQATPFPPTDNEDYPTITIHNAPATQLDFRRIYESEQTFNEAEDCRTFGADGFLVGMKFCLAEMETQSNSLLAALYVCPQGVIDGQCIPAAPNTPLSSIMTTLKAYKRSATVTCSRSNLSITSIPSLSEPMQQVNLDRPALLQAFSWLFNSTAAGVPVPSSVAQYFWSVHDQLASEYWSMEAYQLYMSLLSFPFWHFNDNNYGNVRLQRNETVDSLPQEFYTWASVDKPMSRIMVDRYVFSPFLISPLLGHFMHRHSHIAASFHPSTRVSHHSGVFAFRRRTLRCAFLLTRLFLPFSEQDVLSAVGWLLPSLDAWLLPIPGRIAPCHPLVVPSLSRVAPSLSQVAPFVRLDRSFPPPCDPVATSLLSAAG